MMLDAPSYDVDATNEDEEIVLTESNSSTMMNYINSLM
jgi:hypothetical protein